MSKLVEIRNTDATVHRVPGCGQAEPGQSLAVPPEVAAELLAAPAKADPARPAWERVQPVETPKPSRRGTPAAAGNEEDDHDATQ